jgi:hypothetical protein
VNSPPQDNYSEPLQPAQEQFDGTGSYGNGAAMRVHPVALFCHGHSQDELAEVAKKSALVTHSHKVSLVLSCSLFEQRPFFKYVLKGRNFFEMSFLVL